MINWCILNPLEGEPLELDDPKMVAIESYLAFERRGVELAPGKHTFEMRSEDNMRIRAFQCFQNGRKLELDWIAAGPHEQTKLAQVAFTVAAGGPATVKLWVNDSLNRRDSQRRYVEEVEFVDRAIGELVADLKARGLYEDALVIFTSDHGEALGERKEIGHVQNLHDEMIHVPLVIKPPAGYAGEPQLQARRDSIAPHYDLVPTILDVAGIPALPEQRGSSLREDRPRLLIAQTHRPEAKHDYVCLRDDRFKMILEPDEGTYTMYDLVADPEEQVDVFATQRGEREAWVGQLETIARIVAEGGLTGEDRDPETLERLKALGYL